MKAKKSEIKILKRDDTYPSKEYFENKFDRLSDEIESVQKALAHHRRDSSKDSALWELADKEGDNQK